ncbi:Serine/threonine-protein kinase PknB [Caulifigura coniformis]|uniref:Serine/threonine-protein kinase PknB n=1 Tax=Caulifigura coniformis TaxID=2527983 RepID=A0A517SMJ9_9PLAN|nr:serine/threonine-protein kinase [Caulifigura coniformis]QDT57326.1 Serine/threonine-protein kinase PknB [Caulifigura coniformis]
MIVSLDLFLNTLRRSRLLSEEALAAEVAQFRAHSQGRKDARNFAETLCRKRLLSVWQAQNLLAGKHRGYFLGGYTLQGLIGKGGMSFVYLAEHRLLKRRCAIKVLPAAKAANPALLARFHREARAAATLDHPNVVRMLDGGEIADGASTVHYLVMEYIEGPTLFDVVRHSGPLAVAKAIDVIRQAARGLQHVHAAGLVHRDIKPENLIIDDRGVVRLMDLGLARFVESNEAQLTIQLEGRVLGTANYCAPEQAIDSHRADARADIYSLGCTLYFLLAGRPPFHEGSLAQRLLAHQNATPAGIETLRSDVPPALCSLLRRMMAKSPKERIGTAGEIADALDRMLDSEGRVRKPEAPRAVAAAARPTRLSSDPSPFPELREAIAKVTSVERAVAMLKSDLSDERPRRSGPRTGRPPQAMDFRRARELRRKTSGQRLVASVTASLAVLLSTLATWSPPIQAGSTRTVASVVRRPQEAAAPKISRPVPAPVSRARTVVARGPEGLRSG